LHDGTNGTKLHAVWPTNHAVTLAACLLMAACSADPSTGTSDPAACKPGLPDSAGCPASAPSYKDEIAPLVDDRCAGCHYEGNRNSKQVLITYTDLHSSVSVIEKEVYGCQMPPQGEPVLSESERQRFLQWLVCGAPDN
jgi:hypothetical protein